MTAMLSRRRLAIATTLVAALGEAGNTGAGVGSYAQARIVKKGT